MKTIPMKNHLITCSLVLAQLVAPLAPARAAPPAKPAPLAKADTRPSAAQLSKSGEAKFDAEDYAGALADFTAAEEVSPSPSHQWFIGHSQDHLQHYRAAVEAYAKFIAADSSKLSPKLVSKLAEAGERSAAIKAMPGVIHVETSPASASLSVDGATQERTAPYDLTLAPGSHSLRFSASGFEAETVEADVAYASQRTLSISLHEVPAPPPSPAPPPVAFVPPPPPPPPATPAITRHQLGWVATGLAVVGAGFGTAFGIVAITSNNSFNTTPTLGRAYRAQDFATYSDVTFGAAVALGATGLVLLLGGDSDATPSAAKTPGANGARPAAWTVQATPITLPHGAGAGAQITF